MKTPPPTPEIHYTPEMQAELAARVAIPGRVDGEICVECSLPVTVQSAEAREPSTFYYLNRIHHPGHRPHGTATDGSHKHD
jgi:hypothetical protein